MNDSPARLGESRLWPALALFLYICLNIGLRIWLPRAGTIRVVWLAPTLEVLLLLVLLASDPVTLRRHRAWLRPTALTLVGLLVVAALYSTALLVSDLIRGIGVANDAGQLLASGGLVWLGNNLAFALLYWLLDSGGPTARATMRPNRARASVDWTSIRYFARCVSGITSVGLKAVAFVKPRWR